MKSFYKYLIPSVIATILMSMYAIIDGMFIGQKLSDFGLSAINIAWPITSFLQAIGMSLGLSGGIYISSLMGKGEIDKANKMKLTVVLVIFILSIILGGILMLLSKNILILFKAEGIVLEYAHNYIKVILYGSVFQMLGCGLLPLLKNSGKIKIAFIASLMAMFTNLGLDYLFVIVYEWGLEGAALASVLGQAIAFIICFFAYYKEFKGIDFSLNTIKELFFKALAPFILNYSYSIIIIITNTLCLTLSGDEAVAAYTLLSYLLYIIGACASGVADSIQPLFSYNYGMKNHNNNYKMLKKCLIISFILCFLESIIFYIFQGQLQKLYNLSIEAIEIFNYGIIFYSIGFIFVSFIRVICSYLYSINDERKANILTLAEPFILTPLIYLIFCSLFKLNGLWVSYLIIQILLLLIALMLLKFRIKEDKK